MIQEGTKFAHIRKPSTVVEFIAEAEYRLAEIKTAVVIYRRKEKFFVRRKTEFLANFKPLTTPA
jgi:hypothetical protein